jgi:hypothetical protein
MANKIYVKFKAPKTLKRFLLKYFSGNMYGNYQHPNLTTLSLPTYKDEGCTKLQCAAGRSRSIIDMFDLVKTYYPDTTMKELLSELVSLRPSKKYFGCSFCSTIRRPVMHFGSKMMYFPSNGTKWNKLLKEELGITNITQLYKHYGK